MKHTKGPWTIGSISDKNDPLLDRFNIWAEPKSNASLGNPIADLANDDQFVNEANAHLIASAPEMFCVLNQLATYCRDYLALDDEAEAILKDAFAVLKQAGGE